MLFSLNYLRHLASLPKTITLEQICDAINSIGFEVESTKAFLQVSGLKSVSYTHLTLPTSLAECRSRWSPYH